MMWRNKNVFVGLLLMYSFTTWSQGKKLSERLVLTGKQISVDYKFDNASHIKTLILDSCALRQVPINTAGLINLEHLSLKHNPDLEWAQMIDLIKDLPRLKFMNLSENAISYLPPDLAKLHLEGLRLSHNNIQLDSGVSILLKMPELKRLWIDNNQLDSLTKRIFTFPKLKLLYAYDNNISKLDLPKKQSRSIWVLHLGANSFKELPIELTQLKGVKLVMLNSNQIETIAVEFKSRRYSMNALILDDNPLQSDSRERGKKYFRNMMMYSAR